MVIAPSIGVEVGRRSAERRLSGPVRQTRSRRYAETVPQSNVSEILGRHLAVVGGFDQGLLTAIARSAGELAAQADADAI
jgi:hypothetical protein